MHELSGGPSGYDSVNAEPRRVTTVESSDPLSNFYGATNYVSCPKYNGAA